MKIKPVKYNNVVPRYFKISVTESKLKSTNKQITENALTLTDAYS